MNKDANEHEKQNPFETHIKRSVTLNILSCSKR